MRLPCWILISLSLVITSCKSSSTAPAESSGAGKKPAATNEGAADKKNSAGDGKKASNDSEASQRDDSAAGEMALTRTCQADYLCEEYYNYEHDVDVDKSRCEGFQSGKWSSSKCKHVTAPLAACKESITIFDGSKSYVIEYFYEEEQLEMKKASDCSNLGGPKTYVKKWYLKSQFTEMLKPEITSKKDN